MGSTLGRPLLAEFRRELEATRRLLDLVPTELFDWRPHEQSMTLGRLACHIVEIVRYGSLVLATESLDSERRTRGPLVSASTSDLLEHLDTYSESFSKALAAAGDDQLLGSWSYRKGDRTIFETRRLHALRTFVLNHWYHHRGQLTVYLRELDVPLPQIYGPSADDTTGY